MLNLEHIRRVLILAIVVCLLALLIESVGASPLRHVVAKSPSASRSSDLYVRGQLVIRFRGDAPHNRVASLRREVSLRTLDVNEELRLELVEVMPGEELALIDRLRSDTAVAYVGPNYIARIAAEPDDAEWTRQWNMRQIGLPSAWDLSTGEGLIVAVADTGVDLTHPELVSKLVAGYDFVDGDTVPQDEHGHGTHVAGIVGAASQNGVGVAGVSWGARIMPLRVLNGSGDGTYFDIVQAIQYAADHGAKVINLSLGGVSPDPNLLAAVNYARQRGTLVVAAVGNQAGAVLYPAAYSEVFSVAATTHTEAPADYSNYGSTVDIAAPGGSNSVPVFGLALGGGYASRYGTSMAAPHVTGVASLIWSLAPNLSPDEVATVIERTARRVGTISWDASGWDERLGHGQVDAAAALESVWTDATVTPSPTHTPIPQQDSLEISLRKGWNLISFNVQPSDQRPEVLMDGLRPALDVVLGFTCGAGGLSYYPELPLGLSTLRSLEPGRGYWVKMREARTWRISGERLPADAPLALCAGWNLAGYLPQQTEPLALALSSLGNAYTAVLGFHDGQAVSFYSDLPTYVNTLLEMRQGHGYWILSDRPVTLTYPGP